MMDGTPRKILDSSIARKYGWKPKHNLKEGFEKTYNQYINKFKNKKVISVS
jgi:GDP-L-fucose synthase